MHTNKEFILVLNSSNVSGIYNTNYTYKFINGSFEVPENSKICVSSVTIPYSWFNVNNLLYINNVFSYNYPNTVGGFTQYNVTLLNGFYQVSDLNNAIQLYMFQQGQYIKSGSNIIYFINLLTDQTFYTNQFIFNIVPTAANVVSYYGVGATISNGLYPSVQSCCQVILPTGTTTTSFGSLIGYTANTYPIGSSLPVLPSGTISSTNYSTNVLGNTVPNLTPVNSLIMTCNLVDNNVSIPSNIMDSFNINNTFGGNITYNSNFQKYVSISSGKYQTMSVNLVDQNGNTIQANDYNILITLILSLGSKKLLTYKMSENLGKSNI